MFDTKTFSSITLLTNFLKRYASALDIAYNSNGFISNDIRHDINSIRMWRKEGLFDGNKFIIYIRTHGTFTNSTGGSTLEYNIEYWRPQLVSRITISETPDDEYEVNIVNYKN